jgi:hypothetical protein
MQIYEKARVSTNGKSNGEKSEPPIEQDAMQMVHVPKKNASSLPHVPKKRKMP